MMTQTLKYKLNQNKNREFRLVPRIINPVKIARAAIFSADEQARKAVHSLKEYMPWVQVEVLNDPTSTSNYKSDQPSVLIPVALPFWAPDRA